MSELKTLKELKLTNKEKDEIYLEALNRLPDKPNIEQVMKTILVLTEIKLYEKKRAEAIKWVKHIRSTGIPSKYTMENDFTNFFNITSEDLKNERTK